VFRWGSTSDDNYRIESDILCTSASPIHQSLIGVGNDRGDAYLFHNENLSEDVSSTAMMRFQVGRGRTHKRAITGIIFLEEHVMVTSSMDGAIKVWDCTNPSITSEVLTLDSTDPVTSLGVCQTLEGENTMLVSGTAGGSVHVRDLRSMQGVGDKTANACKHSITSLLVVGGNHEIIAGDSNGCVNIWDMRNMRNLPKVSFNSHSDAAIPVVGSLERLPEVTVRKNSAIISDDVWDVAMGKSKTLKPLKRKLDVPAVEPITSVTFNKAHDNKVLACGFGRPTTMVCVSTDKSIRLFCTITGRMLRCTKLREKPTCAAFNNGLLSIGTRSGFEVSRFEEGHWSPPLKNHSSHVGTVTAISYLGEWGICTGGKDKHVFIHRLEN